MTRQELSKYFERLKSDKKSLIIVLIGFIGMILILISDVGSGEKAQVQNTNDSGIYSESELAFEVEKFIESIDGAGKTKVIISYESYEETVYAYDKDERIDKDGERDFASEYIVLDSGEKEDGLKIKVLTPEIKGVAVSCQGGSNPVIKEQIITALSALFNISSNNISVAVMAK